MFKSALPLLLCLLAAAASAAPLHDPTRPPQAAAPKAGAEATAPIVVSFIVSSPQRRMARVNQRWVAEGDEVAGARVIRIDSGFVRLRRNGRIVQVPLASARMSKRPVDAKE